MLGNPISFSSDDASHTHSLDTLNLLAQYIDFMRSIDKLCDVGCGDGKDLAWWATRTIDDDDDEAVPLNISCTGIDVLPSCKPASTYKNIRYERHDFEMDPFKTNEYDVLWCHNAFQYAITPIATLANFNKMLKNDGMLGIVVPQTTNVVYHKQEYDQLNGQYFNHTLVSLIHMLALLGFDCKSGFFKKNFEDPWLHAIVYKSKHAPMDLRTTKWTDLLEKDLLPSSAEASINRCGYVRQRDLILPWLDKSNRDYGQS